MAASDHISDVVASAKNYSTVDNTQNNNRRAHQSVDPSIIAILRRHNLDHNGKFQYCQNVRCPSRKSNQDPELIIVDAVDEYGVEGHVRCRVCNETMSTECYFTGPRQHHVRVRSVSDLKPGDHIAWHLFHRCPALRLGHWHHAIFIEASGEDKVRLIEQHHGNCSEFFSCSSGIQELDDVVLNFTKSDVYRIEYEDCYSDGYTIERARHLVRNPSSVHCQHANCHDVIIWCKTGHSLTLSHKILSYALAICDTASKVRKMSNNLKRITTVITLSLIGGVAPTDTAYGFQLEVALQAVVCFLLLISVTSSALSLEYKEIKDVKSEKSEEHKADNGCCSSRCCSSTTRAKWRLYSGPFSRVLVRETISVVLPCATYLLVEYLLLRTAIDIVRKIVISCAVMIFMMPVSYLLGVFCGACVEYCCCRCFQNKAKTSNSEPIIEETVLFLADDKAVRNVRNQAVPGEKLEECGSGFQFV